MHPDTSGHRPGYGMVRFNFWECQLGQSVNNGYVLTYWDLFRRISATENEKVLTTFLRPVWHLSRWSEVTHLLQLQSIPVLFTPIFSTEIIEEIMYYIISAKIASGATPVGGPLFK